VCTPSLSEGMSIVGLESLASGAPVLASAAASIEGMEESGSLVVGESETLTSALREVLSWSQLEQNARGKAGKMLVRTKYDWSVVGKLYLDLYETIHT
jgi:glycosyltransferase involved in cell wall biosynthesis